MARVTPGTPINDARGSAGDYTFARNRGGLYIRAKVPPTYTNTTKQQNNRNALAAAVSAWQSTLTQADRDGWNALADRSSPKNPNGGNPRLSGFQLYIRAYRLRYTVTGTAPTSPPATLYVAAKTSVYFDTPSISGSTLTLHFKPSLPTGHFVRISMTPQWSAGRNFPPNYWVRLYQANNADLAENLFTAWTTQFGTPTTGLKVWAKVLVINHNTYSAAPAIIVGTTWTA